MPVTAKFSKQFYDKLGHEVVDELVNHLNHVDATYRSELKELNERNFTRLEALVERRIGQAESRLIRWTFAFWAPTALAMVSLMIAVLLKL